MLKTLFLSIAAGNIIGFIYGVLFLQTKKGRPSTWFHIVFTLCRFALLVAVGMYLLLLPSIQPIILVLSFLTTFWLVILIRKAPSHERYRSYKR